MVKKLNAKVLLVDDEESFVAILSERLRARDLKVSSASCGEDAVELVDRQEYDAIVLDLAMPGMDGLQTLRKIKENHPEAEIIMLTGHGTLQAGVEAIKLGAGDFLEKPVDLNHLLDKIEEAQDKRILVIQERARAEIDAIVKSKPW